MDGNPRIKDMAEKDRPRERLMAEGAEALSSAELVAILLRTGRPGFSALDIARQLLARFQSLDRLARATVEELRGIKGIGRDKAIALKSALTLAQRMARELQLEAPVLDTPDRVADLLREENRLYDAEQFQVLLLNTRRRLIRIERLARGTLDTVMVHPRDVFKLAIAGNASAVVLVAQPSERRSVALGSGHPGHARPDPGWAIAEDRRVDHVILGRRSTERGQDYASLRELGYFLVV